MHLCGSTGGNPLDEGINELKTRELAKNYNIPIAAMGYSKEVEISLILQDIIGIDIMNELTFIKDKYNYLYNVLGIEYADLYNKINSLMLNNSLSISIKDPYEKAKKYSKIDYSIVIDILNGFKSNKKMINNI